MKQRRKTKIRVASKEGGLTQGGGRRDGKKKKAIRLVQDDLRKVEKKTIAFLFDWD